MKITYRFFIFPGAKPDNPYEVSCFIEDIGEYIKVYQYASEHLGCTGHPPPGEKRSMVVVDACEEDEALVELLKMVENAGKRPYFGEFFPSELGQTYFKVSRCRHFDESDFDHARLLRVESWGEEIFTFAGLQDGRFCAKVAGAKWTKRKGVQDPEKIKPRNLLARGRRSDLPTGTMEAWVGDCEVVRTALERPSEG